MNTALRIRFDFEEMAPDSSLLNQKKTLNIYNEVDFYQFSNKNNFS
jgi:hypothetical protein